MPVPEYPPFLPIYIVQVANKQLVICNNLLKQAKWNDKLQTGTVNRNLVLQGQHFGT